jgi:DNA replication protein DnaC
VESNISEVTGPFASNRSTEYWGNILGDNAAASAILDRLLENTNLVRITGKNDRSKTVWPKKGRQRIYVIKINKL